MGTLLTGLGLILAVHAIPMWPDRRAAIVKKTGIVLYQAIFALISLAGLFLIVRGFGSAETYTLWEPPAWSRHVTFLLMLPVFPLLIAGYLPTQIRRIVPHPMIMSIKIWAVAHLVSNGDLASVVLFGGFLIYGVLNLVSIMRRQRAKGVTAKIGPPRNDVIAVILGLAIYAGMLLWGHGAIIGVPLL